MPSYQLIVEVTPHYLPEQSSPEDGVYAFAYSVLIRNTGDIAAQVISRTWHINDAQGLHEKVKGLGVVGHQPLLQPGESFEYTSGSAIATPGTVPSAPRPSSCQKSIPPAPPTVNTAPDCLA